MTKSAFPFVTFRRRDSGLSESPPPYVSETLQHDLAARAANLRLDGAIGQVQPRGKDRLPTPDEALVHLKLLFAFAALRKQTGETDGLFGLWEEDLTVLEKTKPEAQNSDAIVAKLREKRWAVYVTRAADRFSVWWEAWRNVIGAGRLSRTVQKDGALREDWQNAHGKRIVLSQDLLLPLDVLMVWHAFMLNPRCYLEDCLRHDMMALWHTGMPWAAINAVLDPDQGYLPGEAARHEFEAMTGLCWDNLNDPANKDVQCTYYDCQASCSVPWTLVPRADVRQWATTTVASESTSMPLGSGLADPGFLKTCMSCGKALNHDALRAAKFRRDYDKFVANDKVSGASMPGTILDEHGIMSPLGDGDPRLFPTFVMDSIGGWQKRTSVRDIATGFEESMTAARASTPPRPEPSREDRLAVRRLLSRYWDNASGFALDLAGAVVRQGVFVGKMVDINFLHSPVAIAIMARLAIKYVRFMTIMTARMDQVTVPTLDVDLLWHTHQLSPPAYYDYCVARAQLFIDHDDKIAETKLHDAFEATSKAYQKRYNEPYSMCTCWYCEGLRAQDNPSLTARLLRGGSTDLSAAEARDLYGEVATHNDATRGAHISLHNAIRPRGDQVSALYYRGFNGRLRSLLVSARARAAKLGRPAPPMPAVQAGMALQLNTDSNAPYAEPGSFLATGTFALPSSARRDGDVYVGQPGCANVSRGGPGNCAGGTCSGLAAAGGSPVADTGGVYSPPPPPPPGSRSTYAGAGCGGSSGGCGGGGG